MNKEFEYGTAEFWYDQLYKDRMQKRIYATALVYALNQGKPIEDVEFIDILIEKIYLINSTINFDKEHYEEAKKRKK